MIGVHDSGNGVFLSSREKSGRPTIRCGSQFLSRNMEWNDDIVLEFLNLYEGEPAIWDPKHKLHKDRRFLYESWKRIQNSLSLQRPLFEIKKKKGILMATYRKCVLKVKCFEKYGQVYKPEWFAFDKMASFLDTVYRPRQKLRKVEVVEDEPTFVEDGLLDNGTETFNPKESSSLFTACEVEENNDIAKAVDKNGPPRNENQWTKKKIKLIEKRMDEAYLFLKQVSAKPKVVKDESYKFCELLCCKLRLLDADSRRLLTYEINHLVHYFDNWRKSHQNFQYPNDQQPVSPTLPVQIPTTLSTHPNGPRDLQSERICKKFAVISFPDEEDTLFIVASSWLEKTEESDFHVCSWPPYKGDARIKLAVLENRTPTSTWSKCNARLIKQCSTYASAEELLKAIEIVSNCRSELLVEKKCKEIKKEPNTFLSQMCLISSTGSYSPSQPGPIICGVTANVDESFHHNCSSTTSFENDRRNSLSTQTGSFV